MTIRDRVKRYMPRPFLKGYSQARRAPAKLLQSLAQACGYTLARANDYYSPLASVQSLQGTRTRWCKPSAMRGVDYDLNLFKCELARLMAKYSKEFTKLPPYVEIASRGFGPGYTPLDAFSLYMMIRDRKPRKYLEVGAGISTYYSSMAGLRNEAEGYPLNITCIEPNPFEALGTIANIRCIHSDAQGVDPSEFCGLCEGDVLFIDSSHVLKVGGDVAFLYLEVLPILKPGVLVHVHDVPFPYNFPFPPDLWIFGGTWPKFWTEAMVLQAFLAFNSQFKIIMSMPLIRFFEEGFLKESFREYKTVAEEPNTFSALWLQRTGP